MLEPNIAKTLISEFGALMTALMFAIKNIEIGINLSIVINLSLKFVCQLSRLKL